MLKLENVHTYYGNSHILQGVCLEMPEASCVAMLGRNGAGKTTMMHTISGLVTPSQGSIQFRGREISRLKPYEISKQGLALVPQGRRIFPSLTVRENLTMAARPSRDAGGAKRDWDLEAVYEMFPMLKERERNMGHQLSGGQQQMLAIGRALMTNPSLLLMDEPSEGLAPVIIGQVGEIIRSLKKTGLSILLVEQNIFLACGVADEVLIMNKGRIVWRGTPKELMANNEVMREYLGV